MPIVDIIPVKPVELEMQSSCTIMRAYILKSCYLEFENPRRHSA